MNKQTKMYTVELTENELAKVLFVMRSVNGKDAVRSIASFASEKLGVKENTSFDELQSKWEELAKIANLPRFINYYSVQKDWEQFLNVGGFDQVTLDKAIKQEIEPTVLKK